MRFMCLFDVCSGWCIGAGLYGLLVSQGVTYMITVR
jgi:hypothetical protein